MTTWTHPHADWWKSAAGEAIHEVEILDDDDRPTHLFYGYASNATHHCCEAATLREAMHAIDTMERAA